MPALSDLVEWVNAENASYTETEKAAQTLFQALTVIHDTVIYQMATVIMLCNKYGLTTLLDTVPEAQRTQFREAVATIQEAWLETGSDPVPELSEVPILPEEPTE